MRTGVLAVVAAVAVEVALAGPALADPADDARAIALRAREAAERGDLEGVREALVLYKEAYRTHPQPVYLCNAAVAYKLLGDLPRAHALLAGCLPRLPAAQPGAVEHFREQLAGLEAMLAEAHLPVDVITEPAGASLAVSVLGDDEPVVAPVVVWLPPGRHTITARVPGHEPVTETVEVTAEDVTGRARRSVQLRLVPQATDGPEVIERVVDRPAAASPRRTAGWIAVGAGAALFAGGGVMHAITYRTRGRLADLSGEAYAAELPTFRNQRAITLSLYGVGAAAAVTGAVLLTLAPRHADRVTVAPAPGGGALVWLDLSP